MSIIAVKTIIYQKIVALIQAGADIYSATDRDKVRPGSLIRLDTNRSDPRRYTKSEADFPQLLIAYGRWNFKGDSSTARFGDQLGGKPTGRVKTLTQQFRLTLTHRDLQAKLDDALEMGLINAIESAGPTLGISRSILPFVQLGDIEAMTQDVASATASNQSDDTRRAETTFAFPVLARWTQDPSPTQTI